MNIKNKLKEIQTILKYKFKDENILVNSLTHPSYYKDLKKINKNLFNEFERMEFLGDRVLGLVVSTLIFNQFNKFNEGSLTKKFSYLVQKDFLYKIALELNLDCFLRYTKQKINYRQNKSILSDSLESIIGAMYIDGGYNAVKKFITRVWTPYLNLSESNETDPKTQLQEISQKKFKVLPVYKLLKKKGPSHSPIFTISLKALNFNTIKTSAGSIRDAEKKAAKKILDLINESKNY